jgi:hypothetical protein
MRVNCLKPIAPVSIRALIMHPLKPTHTRPSPGFVGAQITPYYDSLLIKITGRARNRRDAVMKLQRALKEFRVRCVGIRDVMHVWLKGGGGRCVCMKWLALSRARVRVRTT